MLGLLARLADVAAILIAAVAAHYWFHVGSSNWSEVELFVAGMSCVLTLMLFPTFGIYQSWRGKQLNELILRSVGAWAVVLMATVALAVGFHRSDAISRSWLTGWAGLGALLLVLGKTAFQGLLARARLGGLNQKAVVLIGTGTYIRSLVRHARQYPQAGYRPIAVFDQEPLRPSHIAGLPVIHDFAALARMVRQRRVNELWLALPLSEEQRIIEFMSAFRNDLVNIRFIPDVRSLALFNHSIVDLLGVPAINLSVSPMTEFQILPKIIFDRLFAVLVLVALLPLLAAIAVAVKVSSPGPIFFRQRRKGADGQEFEILKFRSMKVHQERVGTITQATKNDQRITPIGKILRKTSLDELPQFINVLRGEMSVVGPRPHALAHDDLYKDLVQGYMHRYRIKPGITGWAQINGFRGETDRIEKMEARVKFDLYYIQHWSFWFDLKIVFMTMIKGFGGRNAY